MDELASLLSTTGGFVGLARPVVNRTGLTGRFDIDIMDDAPSPGAAAVGPAITLRGGPEQGARLTTMLREQLGLSMPLVPGERKAVVIDSAERPSPD